MVSAVVIAPLRKWRPEEFSDSEFARCRHLEFSELSTKISLLCHKLSCIINLCRNIRIVILIDLSYKTSLELFKVHYPINGSLLESLFTLGNSFTLVRLGNNQLCESILNIITFKTKLKRSFWNYFI